MMILNIYSSIMSKKLFPWNDRNPELADTVFIAEGARLIGNVKIGDRSSVFYNAILRGDLAPIRIGSCSNIQDNVSVHVTEECGVQVGNFVTVGHNAVLHGCTVEDGSTIGMGAIVMDGALIRRHSIVGAGALVTAGKEFPERSLILGAPAKFIRELSDDEIERSQLNTKHYIVIAQTANQDLENQKKNAACGEGKNA